MAVTVKHSTPADGTFSATGAAAWDADHNFTGTIDVANGGTGAATLTSNALLKGNGTSAISASSITDNGTLVSIANPVTLASPNRSSAAWTTSGINLIQSAATFTDTSSTGTVANIYLNAFKAPTLAATNAITVSSLFGTYFEAPVAGSNVSATQRFAIGAESVYVSTTFRSDAPATFWGTLTANATLTLTGPTTTTTAGFATGVTASGNTKNVNIGTNGASGSTTNITVGSATSGATSSITANGQVTLAPIGGSRAAWTTNGVGLVQSAATWTDTTSTGTVADVRMNMFGAQTLAASNTITVSNLYGAYFASPIAGTNVTATQRYAIATDSLYCIGALVGSGQVNLTGPSGSVTHQFGTATTSSGNTKIVNIGTGGASGSTTNITLGSSTSGATQTTTVNGQVTLAPIGGSAAAWTTSGIALKQSAATFTDTTSTGTVATVYMNSFGAQTMAASNVITVTNLYGVYFADPAAGTNVTAPSRYAVGADSLRISGTVLFAGSFNANGAVTMGTTSGAISIGTSQVGGTVSIGAASQTGTITIGQSTVSQTTNIQAGATASASTKTINLGTGGASGSTTAIAIGSNTSGATSTTTLNGKTVFTGTAQLQGYTVATLPAGTQGMTAFVTDALAPMWNATLVGGGAVVCKAFYNGTAWVAG